MHHIRLQKNQKGYTLIEVMIALFLFSMLITLVMQIMLIASSNYKRMEEKSNALENLRFAMDFMTSEIRSADEYKIDPAPIAGQPKEILKTLNVYKEKAIAGTFDELKFEFKTAQSELLYQGNVLSEDIKNIWIATKQPHVLQPYTILIITIETNETPMVPSLILQGEISLQYKKERTLP